MQTFSYRVAALSTANRQGRPGGNQDALLLGQSVFQGEIVLSGKTDLAGKFLLAVADGVSASRTPDVASQQVLRILSRAFQSSPDEHPGRRITLIHEHFSELGRPGGPNYEMMTTLVGAEVSGRYVTTYNVGDSRAWRVSNRHAEQLTTDHTAAQAMVDEGIAPSGFEDCAGGIYRGLDQYFCASRAAERPKNTLRTELELGDDEVLLLCSDGINELPLGRMRIYDHESLDKYLKRLCEEAITDGSDDNITLVAVRPESA